METASKFFASGIIFLVTLASGVWLSHSGKPLNTVVFTVHKLIALGAVITTAIQIYKGLQSMENQTLLIMLIAFAALCVVALFVTGALMSLGKLSYDVMLTIHKVAPFLLAISAALTIYLLAGRKL
jgi:hypothetical protein